ncbi:OmpA family protein [Wocania ichthyoenteri]|uniref:OmpA family protein n=1 Tax=Wocania ichthyoenteri TaxID=1230531 RepID=UPI00053EB767|nr:OmpA family protein [Wocania ichthyoenteri]
MKLKNYLLTCFILMLSFIASAQYGSQKKADNLFNKFSFVSAAEVYHNLIEKDFNADYATRQLADSYAYMRNPDSAVVHYKRAVQQENIPVEYYYNYAQALRGVKDYKASRIWLKRFKEAGGVVKKDRFSKDSDFINSIFNAKQHYFLTDVNFNSKYSDFGAYEHDGTIYFASSKDIGVSTKHIYGWNEEPFLDIYTAQNRTDSIVDHKSKIKGDINSIYHDGPLTITKDGKTMYFSRNDFNKNVLGKDEQGITHLKIYKASLIGGLWTNVEELNFNSNAYSTGHPALNSDDTKLYFTSDKSGGFGGSDIYYVDINTDGSLGTPQNAGNIINTDKNEMFPFINSENALFFSSDGHAGLGLLDIFGTVSDANNEIISVLNLGVPVNSSKDDFSFFMNDDGLSGFFASNRDGGIGGDDIYAYDRIPQLKIEGTITDATTNEPVQNVMVTLLLDSGDNKIADLQTDENGHFEINIDRDTDYKINTKKENYIDDLRSVITKGIENSVTSINADIVLYPDVKEELPITELYPIYFDFNKYDIRRDGTVELDRIVDLMMNKYPSMVIKIESHTDSRGTSEYNDILSKERAIATYKYLIANGVDASRITEYNGFGERKLANDCDGTINCTEGQHQLNRRTQFIVIKME